MPHPPLTARQRCRAVVVCTALALGLHLPAATAATTTATAAAEASPQAAVDVRAEQWWLDILSVEDVWQRHTRGADVVVAVVDTGVDPTGDLEGAVLPGFTHQGTGRGDRDDDPGFHGSSMAAKIAGRGTGPGIQGLAPEATILPVKLPRLNQHEHTAEALQTLAAMDDPPEIVNMSYNGGGECSEDEQQAVRAAIDAGMILVASAGNNGSGAVLPTTPASCAGVVTVGAFGFYGNDGDQPDVRMIPESEARPYVALAAPGQRMISFDPGSTRPVYYDGTSDAAAITSGAFALVRAAYPDMPSRELVARVLATARPLGPGDRDDAWGFGAVRPLQAIDEDVPADAPNPLYDDLDAAVPPAAGGASEPPSSPGTPGDSTAGPDTTGDADGSREAGAPAAGSDDDGVSTGVVVGIAGALLLLVAIGVAVAVAASRRRTPSRGAR